ACALVVVIKRWSELDSSVAARFVDILFDCEVDVDYSDGLALQTAVSKGRVDLIIRILSQKPNSWTVSMAFPHIFLAADFGEDQTLEVMSLFCEYRNGEDCLEVTTVNTKVDPPIFLAVEKFPRSVRILRALLDAGFYHDQRMKVGVLPEIEEEEEDVTLLF